MSILLESLSRVLLESSDGALLESDTGIPPAPDVGIVIHVSRTSFGTSVGRSANPYITVAREG